MTLDPMTAWPILCTATTNLSVRELRIQIVPHDMTEKRGCFVMHCD